MEPEQWDHKSTTCAKCKIGFGFWTRRHHCRLCGGVFCNSCSDHSLSIPDKGSVRVCDNCFMKQELEALDTSKDTEPLNNEPKVTMYTPFGNPSIYSSKTSAPLDSQDLRDLKTFFQKDEEKEKPIETEKSEENIQKQTSQDEEHPPVGSTANVDLSDSRPPQQQVDEGSDTVERQEDNQNETAPPDRGPLPSNEPKSATQEEKKPVSQISSPETTPISSPLPTRISTPSSSPSSFAKWVTRLSLGELFYSVYRGISDIIRGLVIPWVMLRQSNTVRSLTTECFALNGVVILGSYLLFEYLLYPCFQYALRLTSDSKESEYVVLLSETLLWIFFYVFWMVPVWTVSFVLNAQWYSKIANRTYEYALKLENKDKVGSGTSVYLDPTRAIYRNLIFVVILLLNTLWSYIPYVGSPLYFLAMCWIFSLYCFEYTWTNRGWNTDRSLKYFEERWGYFLGFGIPVTALSFFFDYFPSNCIICLAFPVFIPVAVFIQPGSVAPLKTWPSIPMSSFLDTYFITPLITSGWIDL